MNMSIQKNERFIPIKNYVIAALIAVLAIGITLYAFAWRDAIKENKVSSSYLTKQKLIQEITDLDEASSVFAESPTDYFILISYTGDEKVYNMEKDLKSIIIDYNLSDKMYYVNVTSIKDNDNCIDEINDKLNLKNIKVEKIPTIIYIKDGNAVDITRRSDDNMITSGDFQKLIDINGIKK